MHRDEHADAEYDPSQGEDPPRQVSPEVRPAQQTKQHHLRRSSTIWPSRKATVREQRAATSRSCVTISTVEPRRACRSSISFRISCPVFVSRFPVGSSASSIGG